MRKNRGDITYYLEENESVYHFFKKIKCRSKLITEGKSKTTKKTLSDFTFIENELNLIDFTSVGLKPVDKEIIITMIKELQEGNNDN
ncbi:putative yaiB protein (plasmid) [Yersinia pestis]|uniref:Uncharacterized protein n=1 Tax=Yersinia pestis Java 9 TaxID=880632 RepID=E8PS58_YERPE|nr:hypothetical protein [Yersinia pestis]ADW66858.1 conserved hypothetical protein [Yersinia pestis Java 9]AJJ37965.1 putative yaiB protein [Yersinia pestis]ROZ98618.1 hypothetical protein EGT46_00785 [Yersinia pestis]